MSVTGFSWASRFTGLLVCNLGELWIHTNNYIASTYAALSFETTAGLIMKHNYAAAMQVLIWNCPYGSEHVD